MHGDELVMPPAQPGRALLQHFGIGTLFWRVRDAVVVADAGDGRIVLWNPAAEALFGYSTAEALCLTVDALVPERLRARHRAGRTRYAATGHGRIIDASTPLELPALRKTGEECLVELTLSPIDDAGDRRFVLAIIRDVTERQRREAEQAQRIQEQAARTEGEAAERRFRALVQNAADVTLIVDTNGRVRYASPSVARVLGYDPEAHIGADVFAFVHPEDLERVRQSFANALHEPGVHAWIEFRTRHADGGWRDVEAATNVLFHDPSVAGAVINLRDITERTAHERRQRFLAEATGTLARSLDYTTTLRSVARLAVPALADWCIVDVVDDAGEIHRMPIVHADPAKTAVVRALERYPLEQYPEHHPVVRALRTGEPQLTPVIPDTWAESVAIDAAHLALLRALGPKSGMAVPLRSRGRTLGVITLVSATADRQYGREDLALAEELARRAAFAVDNARLYQDAQRALAETQAALAVRDQFLSIASHELRTPLTALRGSLQIIQRRLQRSGAPAEVQDVMARADRQVERLTRLVRGLLDVSRIAGGQLAVEPTPVALAELVRRAVEQERAAAPDRTIGLTLPEQDPLVAADPDRLEQVLSNLLDNARKYSPADAPIEVRVDVAADTAAVAVRDAGAGIPVDQQERIFGRFHRADNVDRGVAGLGLGLYIAREIVHAHGGSLTVESAPGAGSTFTIRLPLLPPA